MKNLKTIALTLITLSFFSCVQTSDELKVGEVRKINQNDSIELFEYNFSDRYRNVIIARFKNKPALTVNQTIQSGKTTYNQATVIIENDSIIVLRK